MYVNIECLMADDKKITVLTVFPFFKINYYKNLIFKRIHYFKRKTEKSAYLKIPITQDQVTTDKVTTKRFCKLICYMGYCSDKNILLLRDNGSKILIISSMINNNQCSTEIRLQSYK